MGNLRVVVQLPYTISLISCQENRTALPRGPLLSASRDCGLDLAPTAARTIDGNDAERSREKPTPDHHAARLGRA
jgi:hypothetical protein